MTTLRVMTAAVLIVATLASTSRSYKHCGEHWCKCYKYGKWKNKAVCNDHGSKLTFVPALPLYIQTVEFSGNYLPIVSATTFRKITSLNLTDLNLTNNAIGRVEDNAFSAFSYLSMLVLNRNQFATHLLPYILRNLTTIPWHSLYLENCNLTGNTDMFKQLPSATLQLLSLDHNYIKLYNHSDFNALPLLKTLSMGHNVIKRVHLSFSKIMKTLNLRDNFIGSFPKFCNASGGSYFPNVSRLKLDHNSLTEINVQSLTCLRSLVVFSISANKLLKLYTNTFSDLPYLRFVILKNIQGGVSIGSHAFNNSNIQYISLISSGIHFKTSVHYAAFRGCSNIDSLDVSHNVFYGCNNEDFDKWFGHLTSLTGLGLGSGNIKAYPTFLSRDLPNLKYLKLYGNLFEQFPENAFYSMKKLTHLWLSDNRLSNIQERVFPSEVRKRLKVICITNNPFACDCNLLWFINWLKAEHTRFQGYPQRYVCNSPMERKSIMLKDVKLTEALCLMPKPISMAIIGTSALLLLVLVSCSLTYRWRWHIRYYIYQRKNKQGAYHRLETVCIAYEAYVIYNIQDIRWVKQELIANLEGSSGLRLYVRDRDSLAGDTATDNVVNNMAASRAVLVVLSNAMARDEQCQFELMFVQRREGTHGLSPLIVVVLLEEILSRNVTQSVYALVKMHPYICWGDEPHARQLFWGRLASSLSSLQPPRAALDSGGGCDESGSDVGE